MWKVEGIFGTAGHDAADAFLNGLAAEYPNLADYFKTGTLPGAGGSAPQPGQGGGNPAPPPSVLGPVVQDPSRGPVTYLPPSDPSRNPNPTYAEGTPFVAYDQLAHLERGEAVLTVQQNADRSALGGSRTTNITINNPTPEPATNVQHSLLIQGALGYVWDR
jgi:hypothetical protein